MRTDSLPGPRRILEPADLTGRSGLPGVMEGLSPSYGSVAGLNSVCTGAYSLDVRAATNFRGAEKSRVWLGVDILWRDGETEVIEGFITERDAVKWIAEHSNAWQGTTNDKAPQTP